MKTLFTLFIIVVFFPLYAQKEENAVQEEAAVQGTIEAFFEAFHRQDSTGIKRTIHNDIIMRRIALDSTGAASYRRQEFSEFLKAIVSIPEEVQFEEIIESYDIQIDGPLAQVWTPYTFLLNGKTDHCGTNAFQLFKKDAEWKIISIIDTGRKEGCE